MAPKYNLYSDFAVTDALEAAGAPKYDWDFQSGEPPVEFFINAPTHAPAVFSTLFGTKEFRVPKDPTPERDGHYWWAAEIQRVCDELRRNLPDVCKTITTPRTYYDLFEYFDAYDIYYRGAQNLWNVLNSFVFENEYVQKLVSHEQKSRTDQFMPLFEHFASGLLKNTEMQTKLLSWNRDDKTDVLKVLPAYELQIFEGYDKYPTHFLDAIRGIFVRYYDELRKAHSSRIPSLASDRSPKIAVSEHVADLHRYLQSLGTTQDLFMEKFDIPNKIIQGIVIADGTSKTAALRAKHKQAGASSRAHQRELPAQATSPRWVMSQNASWIPKASANATRHGSFTQRCLSAPSTGGDPTSLSDASTAVEPRVYSGDDHEVTQKLMGCQKPTSPEGPSRYASGEVIVPANTASNPSGPLHQAAANVNQSLPPNWHHQTQFSPTRQPVVPSALGFTPVPTPLYKSPGYPSPAMVQDPFAHQFSPNSIQRHQMQGAPTPIQRNQSFRLDQGQYQQGGHPGSALPPPQFRADTNQQNNAQRGVIRDSGGFGQYARNSSTRNNINGKWYQNGSHEIHGPTVIYRKGGANIHEGQTRKTSEWQGRQSNETGRRTSTASSWGNPHQRKNSQAQPNFVHNGGRETNGIASTTEKGLWKPAPGQSWGEPGCVNADKTPDIRTKFDPCNCSHCRGRNKMIYIGGLTTCSSETEVLRRLGQHFGRFGIIENMWPGKKPHMTCAVIKFDNPQSALAAVKTAPRVRVDGLSDRPLVVQFRTGSQFFEPTKTSDSTGDYGNRPQAGYDGRPRIWNHSASAQQRTFMLSGAHTEGQAHHANIENLRDQATTQPGHETVNTGDLTYSTMTSPVITTHPIHGLVVVDATDPSAMADNRQNHTSRFERILSGGTIKDPATDNSNPTHGASTSRQVSGRSPSETTQPLDSNKSQAVVDPPESHGGLADEAGKGEHAALEEEASIDYGTVRIRPGKAQYVAIPPAWREQSSSPPHGQAATSQYLEVASQCGLTPVHRVNSMPDLPSASNKDLIKSTDGQTDTSEAAPQQMSDAHKKLTGDSHAHPKRKVSETDGGGIVPNQPSPKKKFSKLAELPTSQNLDEPQESLTRKPPQPQYRQHQKQQVGDPSQTKTGKKKNKKRDKSNQNQATQHTHDYTVAPPEAQTFHPGISPSHLPVYPQQITHAHNLHGMSTAHGPEPMYFHIPPTAPIAQNVTMNRYPDDIEPFPPYRDSMSGPQPLLSGHRGYHTGTRHLGHNRSISSSASTVMGNYPGQGFGFETAGMNPGAQNFNPGAQNLGPGTDSAFGSHRDSGFELGHSPRGGMMHNRAESHEGSRMNPPIHRPLLEGQDWRVREASREETHLLTTMESNEPTVSASTQSATKGQRSTQQQSSPKKADQVGERPKTKTETHKGKKKANVKTDNTNAETPPKSPCKKTLGNGADTTDAKQGGAKGKGKGKGKSKNAKALSGRNDDQQQRCATPSSVDRKDEAPRSKEPSPQKATNAVRQYSEVLKKDLPVEGISVAGRKEMDGDEHKVEAIKEDQKKNDEATQPDQKGDTTEDTSKKEKDVVSSENQAETVTKEAEAATTTRYRYRPGSADNAFTLQIPATAAAEVQASSDINQDSADDKKSNHPESRGEQVLSKTIPVSKATLAMETSEANLPSGDTSTDGGGSSKPKQGRNKNRAAKKSNKTPINTTTVTSATVANPDTNIGPTPSTGDGPDPGASFTKGEFRLKEEDMNTAQQAGPRPLPQIPSFEKQPKTIPADIVESKKETKQENIAVEKPTRMLAPVPLRDPSGAWRTVDGKLKKTQDQTHTPAQRQTPGHDEGQALAQTQLQDKTNVQQSPVKGGKAGNEAQKEVVKDKDKDGDGDGDGDGKGVKKSKKKKANKREEKEQGQVSGERLPPDGERKGG
ncbi:hypothetical protein F4808DRAFT_475427 [Astrocystis sublimbata]|nr:hypothetical protein F4808DRAFT_475427 [Astrocystis sublimbata]